MADAKYVVGDHRNGDAKVEIDANKRVSRDVRHAAASEEEEARIVSADMADAEYVVGDHRNGDAKIEIDANKRSFSGLTKEELLKYQDDPFWVRLRWFMFVLFWALWLCMLAGAVAIIVRAPKCPAPKEWYKRGPLVELSAGSLEEVEARLPLLKAAAAPAVFVPASLAGDLYGGADLAGFERLAERAEASGVRIIVDMTPNYVDVSHEWFVKSERLEANYTDYFLWSADKGMHEGVHKRPNSWVQVGNDEPSWTWSDVRGAFYLHQHATGTADLNFRNPDVVEHFSGVIRRWVDAGARGFRLHKARYLLVDPKLRENPVSNKPGATHAEAAFWKQSATSDQEELLGLLNKWRDVARGANSNAMFSLADAIDSEPPYVNVTGAGRTFAVDLPSAGPARLTEPAEPLARHLNRLLDYWPAQKFELEQEVALEAGVVGALLPAAPVLAWEQIFAVADNVTTVDGGYARAVALRKEPAVMSGNHSVVAFANGTLLACTRWMSGEKGYLMVWNPSGAERGGDATSLRAVPAQLEVEVLSHNFQVEGVAEKMVVQASNITVSPQSAIIFSFTPVAEE